MLSTHNDFFKTVCPVMAVLFLLGTVSPNIVRAQSDRAATQNFAMLQMAIAAKNGTLSDDEKIREQLTNELQRLLGEVEGTALSGRAMTRLTLFLPPAIAEVLQTAVGTAQLDMLPEQKADALMITVSSLDCDTIMATAVIVYVLTFFDVIPYLGYIANVLFAAAVLCYLGLI